MKQCLRTLAAICVLSLPALAQSPPVTLPVPVTGQGNLAGLLFASNFGQWQIPKGNLGTYSWNAAAYCYAHTVGVTFLAFTVGTPITLVDTANSANTEIVTPTAVSIVQPTGSSPGSCAITIAPIYPHTAYYYTSATAGLQEVITWAGTTAYNVIVTPDWSLLGGTTAMITSAKGNAQVTILDERTSQTVGYTWSGSAYVATPSGGGANWSAISPGTNNNGSLIVGSGSSFAPSGTGIVTANNGVVANQGTSTSYKILTSSVLPGTTAFAANSDAIVSENGSGMTTLGSDFFNALAGGGYEINGTAAAGHFLRGNGNQYVDGLIQSSDVPNNAANTTGNAATANALASTPILCSAGNAPTGILPNGNATGCQSVSGGGGSISGQTAGFIPLAGSATTLTLSAHIDDGKTTAGTLTATESLALNVVGAPSQTGYIYNSTPVVPGSATTAVIGVNSSGQGVMSEAGAAAARLCSATNNVCLSSGGSITATNATVVNQGTNTSYKLMSSSVLTGTSPFAANSDGTISENGSGLTTVGSDFFNALSGGGYEINATAPLAHYLRGNGNQYVDSALLAADLTGTPITGGGTNIETLASATSTANDVETFGNTTGEGQDSGISISAIPDITRTDCINYYEFYSTTSTTPPSNCGPLGSDNGPGSYSAAPTYTTGGVAITSGYHFIFPAADTSGMKAISILVNLNPDTCGNTGVSGSPFILLGNGGAGGGFNLECNSQITGYTDFPDNATLFASNFGSSTRTVSYVSVANGWTVITDICPNDGTTESLYMNGVVVPVYQGGPSACSYTASGPLWLGNTNVINWPGPATYAAVKIYNARPTAAEVANDANAMLFRACKFGGVGCQSQNPQFSAVNWPSLPQIIGFGDSHIEGTSGPSPVNHSYLASVTIGGSAQSAGIAQGYEFHELGQAGQQLIANLLPLFPYNVAPFLERANGSIALVDACTNDVNASVAPAACMTAQAQFAAQVHALGGKAASVSMLSRIGLNSTVDAFNALWRTQCPIYFDSCIDIAADPNLGADNAYSNTTYFQTDGIHLNVTGQNLVAAYVSAEFNRLIYSRNGYRTITSVTLTPTLYGDEKQVTCNPAGGSISITVPSALGATGVKLNIFNVQTSGANTCTLTSVGGQTFAGAASPITIPNNTTVSFISNGTQWISWTAESTTFGVPLAFNAATSGSQSYTNANQFQASFAANVTGYNSVALQNTWTGHSGGEILGMLNDAYTSDYSQCGAKFWYLTNEGDSTTPYYDDGGSAFDIFNNCGNINTESGMGDYMTWFSGSAYGPDTYFLGESIHPNGMVQFPQGVNSYNTNIQATPSAPTGAINSTSGTVAAGSNYGVLVGIDPVDPMANNLTPATTTHSFKGVESSVVTTTDSLHSIAWNWTPSTKVIIYQLFVGSTSGSEANFFYVNPAAYEGTYGTPAVISGGTIAPGTYYMRDIGIDGNGNHTQLGAIDTPATVPSFTGTSTWSGSTNTILINSSAGQPTPFEPISGPGIPSSTTIVAVSGVSPNYTVVLSQPTTGTETGVTLTFSYNAIIWECAPTMFATSHQLWVGTTSGAETNYFTYTPPTGNQTFCEYQETTAPVTSGTTPTFTFLQTNPISSGISGSLPTWNNTGVINNVSITPAGSYPTQAPAVLTIPQGTVLGQVPAVLATTMGSQTSATCTTITGMTFPMLASKSYTLRCNLPITVAASGTLAFCLNGPAGTINYSLDAQGSLGTSGAWLDIPLLNQSAWQVKTTAGSGSTTGFVYSVWATVQNSTSAGTLSVQTAADGTHAIDVLANADCTFTQAN
ncbi:MAG: SGNH/GDSL hydrolase family protein [Terracidiphilus sp.]